MRLALFAILALALAPPTTLLRYKHPVGRVLRYDVGQTFSAILKAGDQPAKPTMGLQTNMTEERRVASASGATAVVRERALRGSTTRTLPMPRMTEVVPDVQRAYTFDALGRCLSLKREAPPGVRPQPSQFLDELSVPLPEKPVAGGSTWSGETTAVGPSGKGRIKLAFAGKVIGVEKHLGRQCFHIEISISGRFTQEATTTFKAASGEVQGNITQWFDAQAGLDTETSADITITVKGQTDIQGKPVDAVSTTSLKSRQLLAK